MPNKAVNLTGSMLSLTLLRIYTDSIAEAQAVLEKSIQQAPDFFCGIPVILEPQTPLQNSDFLPALIAYLQQVKMVPIGIRSSDPQILSQAAALQLPILPVEPSKSAPPAEPKRQQSETHTTRIVDHAVRSGQQIYARNRDLIIRGGVNPGAEVMADGNVHIYGKVRGKVFAGSAGDTSARIYAQELDPELICIAGFYQLADNIEARYKKGFTEISLRSENLVFNTIIQ